MPWDTISFEEGVHSVSVNKLYQSVHTQSLSGVAVPTLKTLFSPDLNLSPEQGLLQLVHSELEWIGARLSDLEDKHGLRTTCLEASKP